MKRLLISVLLITVGLLLAACSAAVTPTAQPAAMPTLAPATVAPTAPASATPLPTLTPTATPLPTVAPTATPSPVVVATAPATDTPLPPAEPTAVKIDAETGGQVWQTKECIDCHGDNAEGDRGPTLAGTGLTVGAVLLQVRTGKGRMPDFTTEEVSDIEVQQIYAWLRSLPKPTPEATPTEVPTAAAAADPAAGLPDRRVERFLGIGQRSEG